MTNLVQIEETSESGVAVLRLNRPPVNAISQEMTQQLIASVNQASANPELRALVVWGGPEVFAAGADISEFQIDDPQKMQERVGALGYALMLLENLPLITISAVNGYALGGGCEIAISTDFRFLAEDAVLGQPEIKLGIIPGAGGTQRLAPLIGLSKAKELVYSGRAVKAPEALEIGLADAVHPSQDLYSAALERAAKYARGPAALKNAKRAIHAGRALSYTDALHNEAREFAACFETEDAKIGVASFLKEGPGKASFTGR